MKKLAALFFTVGLIAFLYGCGGGSSDYFGIAHQDISKKINTRVDSFGRFTATFPSSGAIIKAEEANTMTEGVLVKVTETMTDSLGVNPIGKPDHINIYEITAELVDSDNKKTEVTSLEKPLKLILPTNHLGNKGICYAGVRDDKYSPWKYKRLSDSENIPASQISLQDSASKKLMPSYSFELFEVGIQVALFAYYKPITEARKDVSVAEIVATTTPLLNLDDNENYLDDLDINVKLKGDNLSDLAVSDINLSIVYRTNRNTPVTIKSNGYACWQTTEKMGDDAVAGRNYYVHTLKISNFDASFAGEGEVNFKLDLKGINKSDFPTDFLLNVSGGGNSEKVIPFSYSKNISYKVEKTKSPEPDPDPVPDPEVYVISYDLAGGSLAEGDSNPEYYGEASDTIILKNPVKTGYTFAGWTGTDLNAPTMEVSIVNGSTGDRSYTANWTAISYAIVYDLKEGSLADGVTNPTAYDIASSNITLNNPEKSGYTFIGWTGTEIEEGTASNTVTIPQGSIGERSYTASWTPAIYTIAYDLNGGSLADGVTNPETYDITSEAITLNNPVYGYPFKGWSGTDLTGDENQTVTIAQGSIGDRSYTANWIDIPITYTITYELNEGILATGAVNPIAYDVTSATITLNNPIREGYTFKGWSGTGLTGDENQTVAITQGSLGDRTYTANWIPTSYAINYDLVEGTLADGVTNPVSYDITSATITLNNPVREDYYFEGWTGTGIEEGTASMTVTIPQGSMGERSYVASWTLMTIRLTIPGSSEIVTFQRPQHTDDFFMAIYEVTKSQYEAINGSGTDPSYHTVSPSHPVDFVDWNGANSTCIAFSEMLSAANTLPEGYKVELPTYEQWMYTCYAGSDGDYCFGVDGEQVTESTLSDYAVYNNPSYTSPVGSKKPNYWGFYDMHGNVYEWILDNPPSMMIFGFHFKFGGSWSVNAAGCNAWPIVISGSAPVEYDVGFRFALVPAVLP